MVQIHLKLKAPQGECKSHISSTQSEPEKFTEPSKGSLRARGVAQSQTARGQNSVLETRSEKSNDGTGEGPGGRSARGRAAAGRRHRPARPAAGTHLAEELLLPAHLGPLLLGRGPPGSPVRGAGAQRRQLYAAARGRRGLRREGPGGRHPLDADPAGKEGGIVRGSAARSRSRAGRALTAAAGCGRGPGSGTRRHPPRRSTAAPPFRRQGRGAAAAPPGGRGERSAAGHSAAHCAHSGTAARRFCASDAAAAARGAALPALARPAGWDVRGVGKYGENAALTLI